jgi:DNA repair photolyase
MTTAVEEKPLIATPRVIPRLVRVARRGPLLRPSPISVGVYGLDLTAGCLHGCVYCHIQSSSRIPVDGRILFDPFTSESLPEALDTLELRPECVVLSPSSDPLPPIRDVRLEAFRVIEGLLQRGIRVQIMTRGRFSRGLIDLLAKHRDLVKVAIGITTLDKTLSRILEPRATAPASRIRDIRRLIAAEIDVEVRLEPLSPGHTDTQENIRPLFQAISSAGARHVVAHYLYLHPTLEEQLETAFQPLPWGERLRDDFEGGHVFRLGSIGPTKHLPLELRRSGLARLISWGIASGLSVTTGSSQNPDLPKLR